VPRALVRLPALCLLVGLLLGAAPALAAGVSPRLDLSSPASAPFPSNRWTTIDVRERTNLRVALPKPDCAARPSDCADIDVLNALDGFDVQPRLSIPFTGPIDPASVSSDDVFLVRLGGGTGAGHHRVGINQVSWDPATNTLNAQSDELLDQDTTYLLVVTRGVRDPAGNPVGAVDLRSAFLAARPADRLYLGVLLLSLGAAGVPPTQIAAASVFTTRSATAIMEKIRRQLAAAHPAPARFDLVPGQRTVFPLKADTLVTFNRQTTTTGPLAPSTIPAGLLLGGSVGTLAFGSYRSPDYETAAGVIPPVGTRLGVPAVQSTNDIAFNLFLPAGPEPAGGWPVAIFGHGFTDNKNSSPFVVAGSMARAGIATIAVNVVGHGGGPNGTLTVSGGGAAPVTFTAGGRGVDQDGNGTIDSTEGVSALPPATIVSSTDGLNQTVVDLMQLVREIQVGVDVDGDGHPDLDASRISYFGQSFGGIYGTEFMGAEPSVRTGVLNVPGGPIIEIARLSPVFRPLVAGALAARTPPLLNGGNVFFTESIPLRGEPPVVEAPGADAIQQVIANTAWVSATSNPAAWAPHLRLDPLDGVPAKDVIVQFAKGDMTVPNPTASALIRAGRLTDRTTYFRNDLAFAANPAFGRDPHTFLTRITASAPVAAVALEAQAQIATFFASGGTTFVDPDGPGPLFETPIAGPLPEALNFIPPP
jgi:hypothetical protein